MVLHGRLQVLRNVLLADELLDAALRLGIKRIGVQTAQHGSLLALCGENLIPKATHHPREFCAIPARRCRHQLRLGLER